MDRYQTWPATATGWQVKDLSGAPFNLPADAVVEIAIRNTSVGSEQWGGVRAVGSGLERRFQIHEAEPAGSDVVVMHVQADGSSQIEHYAGGTAAIEFVLLGYWNCVTYVEAFQQFSAGADAAWRDHDLAPYGVGSGEAAEIVVANTSGNWQREGGVRTNGSVMERRVLLHEAEQGGVDLVTMCVQADATVNATIDVYAEADADVSFYLMGYWTTPPGPYTELFGDLGSPTADATWEDRDLSAFTVPADAVAEVLLANTDGATRNNMGVRAKSSSLARRLDLHESEGGGGDFGRMHAEADAASTIQFYHEDVSDAHTFWLTGYWAPQTTLPLADHTAGQESDAFRNFGTETDAELFAFQFDPCLSAFNVTEVVFSLSSIVGLDDADWADIEIVEDTNDDGNIGAGETTTVGGAGTVDTAAGTVTFSTSFNVTAATNYILRADFSFLEDGDTVRLDLAPAGVTASATVVGSTSSVTHREGCAYVGSFQPWTATNPGTWETQDLSSAPFNVPADAVVEIGVRNAQFNSPYSGGVRAVGSLLDRRILLQEAEPNGTDIVVMTVQADSSSRIEHYAENTAQIDFVLLGYWDCGTYVQTFQSFNAGADASWQSHDLNAYGVGQEQVVEILMVNGSTANEREAGVRRKGSSLERRLDLHEAEGGGEDTVTLHVQADATANATVELYAEDDLDIGFYLLGYWSSPPAAFRERLTNIGSPSSSGTWEDVDLTSFGAGLSATVDLVLSNTDVNAGANMGVRPNGSSLARLFDIHEAEDGGGDFGRMHVTADTDGIIEFYHENVANSHSFLITGIWGASMVKIVRWREIEPN
jgi:hypothetical protein